MNHPDNTNRREFLSRTGTGMAMLGLAGMIGNKPVNAATKLSANPMVPRAPHFSPKAKRVIHIFLNGGLSHVDSFDPKPMLTKYHGKKLPFHLKTERETGAALASPFKFKNYGESGIPISELFEELGQVADELCVVRSMQANVPNHEPSLMLMNCGDSILPRPSFGSWATYGLGSENQSLPGFIAMCPNGLPIKGSANWQNAFLPGAFQGTYINTKHKEVDKLISHVRNSALSTRRQRQQIDLLQTLNQQHLEARGTDPNLEARIQSFELAYRMQMSATDAFDTTKEPAYIQEMYGDTTQSRQLLMARRLIERGVRFVQLWHGAGQPWDNHDNIEKGHRRLARECSQGIAALILDLKQRGMLEDTLVLCSGEFGRTPTVELPKPGANKSFANGRDHNHHGFSLWMAGGGVKGGHIHGATDDFGFKAVKDNVHVHDLHATMLHLMGFDHEKLTYRYAGRDFRLTDVHGHVVHDLIA